MKILNKGGDEKMSIYDKLYPFQKNVVDKFRSYKKFGLFLDMGLG